MVVKSKEELPATILGAGLLTLDSIVSNSQSGGLGHRIGGTFGNVVSICQTLGLHARPITRMGVDPAGEKIVSELETLGVDCSFVELDTAVKTRQIIELTPSKFGEKHRFTFVCPSFQNRLPQGNPLTIRTANNLSIDWKSVGLFFFDSPLPSSLVLARQAVKSGCVVMFEPYRLEDSRKFRDAIAVSDVLKYAEEVGNPPLDGLLPKSGKIPRLIIETMGAAGLRFRLRGGANILSKWIKQPAFDPSDPKDSASAGDWCSAGFIKQFLSGPTDRHWNHRYIARALRYGQALAAGSVSFLGPRGYSDCVTASDIHRAAVATLRGKRVPLWVSESQIDQTFSGSNHNGTWKARNLCAFCLQEK